MFPVIKLNRDSIRQAARRKEICLLEKYHTPLVEIKVLTTLITRKWYYLWICTAIIIKRGTGFCYIMMHRTNLYLKKMYHTCICNKIFHCALLKYMKFVPNREMSCDFTFFWTRYSFLDFFSAFWLLSGVLHDDTVKHLTSRRSQSKCFRDPSVLVCYLEWCWIYEILISVKLVWPLSSSQTYNAVVIISLFYSDKREIIKYEFEPYFIANYKCVIRLDFITLGRYCGWWNMNLTEPSSQYLLLWYLSCNLDESKAATLPMEMDIFD